MFYSEVMHEKVVNKNSLNSVNVFLCHYELVEIHGLKAEEE